MSDGKRRPTEAELEELRDAALECVRTAEEYWNSIVRWPLSVEMAPGLAKADVERIEVTLRPLSCHVVSAIARFEDQPSAVTEFVEAVAARDPANVAGTCAHREARDLANEIIGNGASIPVPYTNPECFDTALILAQWDRTRSVVENSVEGRKRWRDLEQRIRREYHLATDALGASRTAAEEEGETAEKAIMDKLRWALSRLGAEAKADEVIREAKVNTRKGRDALRQLEAQEEYRGFARSRPERYQDRKSSSIPEP